MLNFKEEYFEFFFTMSELKILAQVNIIKGSYNIYLC